MCVFKGTHVQASRKIVERSSDLFSVKDVLKVKGNRAKESEKWVVEWLAK